MSLKVYYCKQDENPSIQHQIVPAPQLSITPELYYANDNIVGYTYNLNINGYAMAKESGPPDYGLAPTVDSIAKIRHIFNVNGGNLYIKNGDNIDIFVAKGATIKKIEFTGSDNKWVNYAPFSIEIEFNEVDFKGCDNNPIITCSGSIFHTDQEPTSQIISDHFVDLKEYKIKSFNDKWTFNIDDQSYQNNYIIKVSYNVSATGKNYYVNNHLVPAWQQARLFVQDKLYKQVKSLINGVLPIENNNDSACSATKNITELHEPDNISPRTSGALNNFTNSEDLNNINAPLFNIYNETITCETSESDGTFSITYNATIKKDNPLITDQENAAIHTYSKTITTNADQTIDSSINVKGTVQGLVRGGFVNTYNTNFILPQNGTLITSLDNNETKYSNALAYFKVKIGSNTDLNNDMKQLLNITKGQLLLKTNNYNDYIAKPSVFTLEHNYHDGTISYTANYDRTTAMATAYGFTNISITRQDPVEIIQEFVVPGRIAGPVIQKLGMATARTVTVNIEGADIRNRGCTITDPCSGLPYTSLDINFNTLLQESNQWLRTKEDYTVNKLDGSFNISLEYTIRDCP